MKLATIALAALILECLLSREPVTCRANPRSRYFRPYSAYPKPRTSDQRMGDGCPQHRRRVHRGATFTGVSRQSYVGEVITQQTPCAVWDYGDVGIWLKGLTPGYVALLH